MIVRSSMIVLLAMVIVGPCGAATFDVTAPPVPAGIGFTGVVDTTADTFLLTSVTDGASPQPFWTISAPILMNALNSAGLPYDVPDAWDGTIDSTWGFVGPQLGSITVFNEGSVTSAWNLWTTGWGGMINSGGTPIMGPTHLNAMANWPYTATNSAGFWITQPGHGTLSVTSSTIPLPTALPMGLALIGALAWRRR